MTPVPHVLTVRCHWCSHQIPPHRVHQLASGQFLCENCAAWHVNALDVLGGGIPCGCQECGATWEFMRDSVPGVEVKLYVVPKDGILQVLCSACIKAYAPKRADLYHGTEFGAKTLNL